VLVVGLVLFFNRRLVELRDLSGGLGLGVALLVIASIIWAMYGLAQKTLLRRLTSQQILMLIYTGATVLLLPTASPGDIWHLGALHAWTLTFCCANTLIAYGAFVEALECWEVSRVSAVLAVAPLLTMTSMVLIQYFAPGLLQPEGLNAASVVGALLVVGGSAMCALGSS
jgi:drug/metabolite transporter (DMT)-like permease